MPSSLSCFCTIELMPRMRVRSSLGPAPPASGLTGAPEPVETDMLEMAALDGWRAAVPERQPQVGGRRRRLWPSVQRGRRAWADALTGAAVVPGGRRSADCPLIARSKRSPSGAARGATSIFGSSGAGACETP